MTGLSQTGSYFQTGQQNTQWYSSGSLFSTRHCDINLSTCQQPETSNYPEPLIAQQGLSSEQHVRQLNVNSYSGVKMTGRHDINAAFYNRLKSNRDGHVTQTPHKYPGYTAKEHSIRNFQNSGTHIQQSQNSLNSFLPPSTGHLTTLQMPTGEVAGSQDLMTTNSQRHHGRLNSVQPQAFTNGFGSNQNQLKDSQLFNSSVNPHQSNSLNMYDSCLNLYQQSHSNFTPLVNHQENQFSKLAKSAVCQATSDNVLTSSNRCPVKSYRPAKTNFGSFQINSFGCSENDIATTPALEGRNSYQMGSFPAAVCDQGIQVNGHGKELPGSRHHHRYQPYRQASKIRHNASLNENSNKLTEDTSHKFTSTLNSKDSQHSNTEVFSDSDTMQRWYNMPTEENNNDKKKLSSYKDTSKASTGKSVMSSSQTECTVKQVPSCVTVGSNSSASVVYDHELHVPDTSSATNQSSQDKSRDGDTCMSDIHNSHVSSYQRTKMLVSSEVSSDGKSQMKEIPDNHCGDLTNFVKLESVRHDYSGSDSLSENQINLISPEETGAELTETCETETTPPLIEDSEENSCDDCPLPAIKYVPRNTPKPALKPTAISEKSVSIMNEMNSTKCKASKVNCVRQSIDASKCRTETKRKVQMAWIEKHVKMNTSKRLKKDHKDKLSVKKPVTVMKVKHSAHKKQHLTKGKNGLVKQRHSCKRIRSTISVSKHSNIVKKKNKEFLKSNKKSLKECSDTNISNLSKHRSENFQQFPKKNAGNYKHCETHKTPNQEQASKGKSSNTSALDAGALEEPCCSLIYEKTMPFPSCRGFEIVKYHGKQLICLNLPDGKFFVMKEFLAKCLITVNKKTLFRAKCRVLQIRHRELDQRYRKDIIEYLLEERPLGKKIFNTPDHNMHIGIILIQDANKLYHYLTSKQTIAKCSRKPKAKCSDLAACETKQIDNEKHTSDNSSVVTDIESNKDGSDMIKMSEKTFKQKDSYTDDERSSVASDSTLLYIDSDGILDDNALENSLSTAKVITEYENTNQTSRKTLKENICMSLGKGETGDKLNIISEDVFCGGNMCMCNENRNSVIPEMCVCSDSVDDLNGFPVSMSGKCHCASCQITDKENDESAEVIVICASCNKDSSFNCCESSLENASQAENVLGINDSAFTCGASQSSSNLQLGVTKTEGESSAETVSTGDDQLTLCHFQPQPQTHTRCSTHLCTDVLTSDDISSVATSQAENQIDDTSELAIPNVRLSAGVDAIIHELNVTPEVKKEGVSGEQSCEMTDKLNRVYEIFHDVPRAAILNVVVELCEKIHHLQKKNVTLTSEISRMNEENTELLHTATHYENMVKEFAMSFKDAEED